MRRRDFMKVIASSALAWPQPATAQPAERVRRIGMLLSASPSDTEFHAWRDAFLQTRALSGWTIGKNIHVETRWTKGNAAEARRLSTELVALGPDVIVAHGASVLGPLLQVTRTVPVVFTQVIDPVGSGLVRNLARPGGNVTGFLTFEYSISAKWLDLLKEIAPGVTRIAVLRTAAAAAGIGQFSAIQTVAAWPK